MAVRARLADLFGIVDDHFFTEVADCAVDSPAELTRKLVADVFASGDAERLFVLADLFAVHVQEFDLALLLLGRALALEVATKGPEHTNVAGSYNNMAVVLEKQGEFEQAMGMYEKALAIKIKARGPEHSSVAITYNNMAAVLMQQGELGQALGLYEKCLAIEIRVLGRTTRTSPAPTTTWPSY